MNIRLAEDETGSKNRPRAEGVLALIAISLLLAVAFLQLSPATTNTIVSEIKNIVSSTPTGASSSTGAFTIYSPLIMNGEANVSYPADFSSLSSYTLGLINQDRANQSAPPVALGNNRAAQQHADSMLRYDYFSHFDTQGFKPYMRYTLLGGTGAVSENVAYISWKGNHFVDASAKDGSISTLEHAMMYNDSLCCKNGHRLNIINPLHDRVSLGLAYNSTTLFFVEDFENYYIDLTYNTSRAYVFSMGGRMVTPQASPTQIYVTFDGTPSTMTPANLNSGPREYGAGDLLGGVLPPCSASCTIFSTGITVRATTWLATPQSLSITFDLSRFIQVNGAGVYTVYLLTGQDTGSAVTSISVFVSK